MCAGDLCGRLVVAIVHKQTFETEPQFLKYFVRKYNVQRVIESGRALHFEALEDLSSKTLSEEFDPGSE